MRCRLKGCHYENLHMGNANTALVEFTGGVSFGISPTKIAADEIFKRIDYSLNRQNALVSCITSSAVVCPNRTIYCCCCCCCCHHHHHYHYYYYYYYFRFLFNRFIFFGLYSRLGHVPEEEPLRIAGARFLKAVCPSYHPNNTVRTLCEVDRTAP